MSIGAKFDDVRGYDLRVDGLVIVFGELPRLPGRGDLAWRVDQIDWLVT